MILLRDTDDEESLRSAFRELFAKNADVGPIHDPSATAPLWRQLAALGALTMGMPEHRGGGGATLSQLCILAEESGRTLTTMGLVEHLASARLLSTLPETKLAENEIDYATTTLALRPSIEGIWQTVLTTPHTRTVAGIHGEYVGVLELSSTAVRVTHESTRLRFCDITIDDAAFTPLGLAALMASAVDEWRVLSAALLIGACEAVMARVVAYVGSRSQFQRPVGSYQAVQHGLADLPGAISGARLLMSKAAWSFDDVAQPGTVDLARNHFTDAQVLASMAFLFAAGTSTEVVDRAAHYHGAVGAAVETGMHDYYRVARSLPLLVGPLSIERRRLADLLLEPTWTSH